MPEGTDASWRAALYRRREVQRLAAHSEGLPVTGPTRSQGDAGRLLSAGHWRSGALWEHRDDTSPIRGDTSGQREVGIDRDIESERADPGTTPSGEKSAIGSIATTTVHVVGSSHVEWRTGDVRCLHLSRLRGQGSCRESSCRRVAESRCSRLDRRDGIDDWRQPPSDDRQRTDEVSIRSCDLESELFQKGVDPVGARWAHATRDDRWPNTDPASSL